ncbi:MAG: DUF1236 domain-containing protein, partial [Roseovarius sp.]|nr:DUF1236 domain-containing protein [Roseovarius sp.]
SMKKPLLISAALLIAGPAFAQGTQGAPAPERAQDQQLGEQQSAPAETMAPPATTGQGQPRAAPDSAQVPIGSSRAADDPKIPRSETTGQGEPPVGRSNTTGQGAAGTSASLTGDQRAKISTSIKQQNVAPVTNVNFAIAIGTAIPGDIRRAPLPRSVIDVYPAWRGYEFIMIGGDIVIIDPMTLRIVAILET